MRKLLEKRLQDGSERGSREKMTRRAQAVVQEVIGACKKFETEFGSMFEYALQSQLPEAK